MNPYLWLGAGLVWVASIAAAGWWAYGAGQDSELATKAREDRTAAIATESAASAAAAAINRIEVKHVTVRQQLEREVIDRPVYRDCRSGPDAVGLFNSAIPASAAEPGPGGGELPATDAAGR